MRGCPGGQGLGAPRRLGSALLAVLLERHGALPPGVEAGLLLAAHAAYEAGGAADAMDALVQLAARAARAWAASGDWQPLVQLVAGARPPFHPCCSAARFSMPYFIPDTDKHRAVPRMWNTSGE